MINELQHYLLIKLAICELIKPVKWMLCLITKLLRLVVFQTHEIAQPNGIDGKIEFNWLDLVNRKCRKLSHMFQFPPIEPIRSRSPWPLSPHTNGWNQIKWKFLAMPRSLLMPADKQNGINQICPWTIVHSTRAAECCSNQTDCRPAFDI